MGILSAIGGVFGNMFGTAKAGQSIIDHISNGLDKLNYSDQEKAEDAIKVKGMMMTAYQKWLESTTGSRIARRIIALIVVGIWAMEHVVATVMEASAPFVSDSKALMESAHVLAAQASNDASLVMVVLGFYFGGPVVANTLPNVLNKWADKTAKATQINEATKS